MTQTTPTAKDIAGCINFAMLTLTDTCAILDGTGTVFDGQDSVPCRLLKPNSNVSWNSEGAIVNTTTWTAILPMWVNVKLWWSGPRYIRYQNMEFKIDSVEEIHTFNLFHVLKLSLNGTYGDQIILGQEGEPGNYPPILTENWESILVEIRTP